IFRRENLIEAVSPYVREWTDGVPLADRVIFRREPLLFPVSCRKIGFAPSRLFALVPGSIPSRGVIDRNSLRVGGEVPRAIQADRSGQFTRKVDLAAISMLVVPQFHLVIPADNRT